MMIEKFIEMIKNSAYKFVAGVRNLSELTEEAEREAELEIKTHPNEDMRGEGDEFVPGITVYIEPIKVDTREGTKVRMKVDLTVNSKGSGEFVLEKGRILDVSRTTRSNPYGAPTWYVLGDDGEEVWLHPSEAEIV